MFIIGTGMRYSPLPRYWYRGWQFSWAAAWAAASEAARMALAPSLDLFSVPSNSIILASRAAWSVTSMPLSASLMGPVTLPTAVSTPLPR